MTPQDSRHLAILGGLFAALLLLTWLSSGRKSHNSPSSAGILFSDTALASVGNPTMESLRSCPTDRCLTAYMAPWCGVCRASTEFVLTLKPWLQKRGVTTRIVIGRDRPEAVAEYAAVFGPGTFMDPDGKLPIQTGVPEFSITDPSGKIIKRLPGLPKLYRPPISEEDLNSFAAALGLLH